ncbi:MAG TPA: hypothetical protein VGN81_03535, partial [Pseudonocardiaceae bacterium]
MHAASVPVNIADVRPVGRPDSTDLVCSVITRVDVGLLVGIALLFGQEAFELAAKFLRRGHPV